MELKVYQHTFLFRQGLWTARGVYYDAAGHRFPTEGQSLITHQPDVWIADGTLKILADQPHEFRNRYEITPFAPGADTTVWRSFNPDLESLHGRYVIVEDSIISPWRSDSGRFWGTEFLVQVSPAEYRGRGFLYQEETKMSSWAVQLVLTQNSR
ncbi:MAG: hypothetical protein AB1896_11345 [Thermodesulfobacteriota bacterium]